MKLVLVLAALCAVALATPVQEHDYTPKVADKAFLEKQKAVLTLFARINQRSHYKPHVEIAGSYDPEHNVEGYVKPHPVEHFFHYYHNDILQRDEVFSVFNNVHLQQAITLFNMFYYAKDFDTFYKTAVWARQHVNQGMFFYAVSVAVVHREDTHGIVIPPVYEIYPHYFFNTEVIHQAEHYKQMYHGQQKVEGYQHPYVIHANYSGNYLNLHPDQSMSYYLEDVGINAFYWHYHIFYPFWMDSKEYGIESSHRGEQFYYTHQQLLARYYLERLSHKWGEVSYFNWDLPFETGYYPSMQYPNGLEFPERPNFANLHEYFYNYGQKWFFKSEYGYSYQFVHDFERRIADAIHLGWVFNDHAEKVDLYSEEGINILGDLVEGNADSVHFRYYGGYDHEHHHYHGGYVHFARHVLGYAKQPLDYHHVHASALEHYETSLRDPAFYQFFKKVVLFFQGYKYNLEPYTKKHLYFEGVKVTNVEMDRLITYFEDFDADITNAVFFNEEEWDDYKFNIVARQHRLTHKPFTYKVAVHSAKDVTASVRVYVGPKYDEYGRVIDINENRVNFVQLDHFTYDLKNGDNVIERNSDHAYFYHHDHTTYKQLYMKVMKALEGGEQFHVGGEHGKEFFYGFPHRYMIPIGTHEGVEYQFVFVVSPYVPFHHEQNEQHHSHVSHYVDGYALGYPFDRHIDEHVYYQMPNIYHHVTKVYHRHVDDINVTNKVNDVHS